MLQIRRDEPVVKWIVRFLVPLMKWGLIISVIGAILTQL